MKRIARALTIFSVFGLFMSASAFGEDAGQTQTKDTVAAEGAAAPQASETQCDGCCDQGWCNLGEPFKVSDVLFDECDSGPTIGGWMQWGYHSQDTPGIGRFNSHPHRFNMHQGWIYVEKKADGCKGLDWGYRADWVYGVDGADTQSFGNTPGRFDYLNGFDHGIYGWAIPQLYAELAYGDLSVKAGHFYTIVGYEVVTAPDNFFYSHAYTMYNSEPFTHTGVLASYAVSEKVQVHAGWTLGWDTGFDRFDDGSNFLGGASVGLTDNVTFTYITTIGDFGWRGEGYAHSAVLGYSVTEKLNYVLQSDLVETNAGADHQYGVHQYLLYAINDCLGAGARLEWWKNADNSQYEATFGVNIKPHANLVIRPEIRHDWNPGNRQNVTTFGSDVILTF